MKRDREYILCSKHITGYNYITCIRLIVEYEDDEVLAGSSGGV